jgi:hypothetical protein
MGAVRPTVHGTNSWPNSWRERGTALSKVLLPSARYQLARNSKVKEICHTVCGFGAGAARIERAEP